MRIGVATKRELRGANDLEEFEELPSLAIQTLEEALAKEWDTDAHLVLYSYPEREGWPRTNRIALADPACPRPVCWGVALDWDMPGHADLTPEAEDTLFNQLQNSSLPLPTYIWATKRGMRLLYVWDSPVEPEENESIYQGLLREYESVGILCDPTPTVGRWNTLHRLPHVTRDDTPTWPCTFHTFEVTHDARKMPRGKSSTVAVSIDMVRGPVPDIPSSKALVFQDGSTLTPWGKMAKRQFKPRDMNREQFFNRAALYAPEGDRNPTLFKKAAAMVGKLFDLPGTTPEHIFGLMIDSVMLGMPNTRDRDFIAELWKSIQYCWNRHKSSTILEELEQMEHFKEVKDLESEVIKGMEQWPVAPVLPPVVDRPRWLRQRLFVKPIRGAYFPLLPSGRYDTSNPIERGHLISYLKTNPMGTLIGLTKDGEDRSIQEIINSHTMQLSGTVTLLTQDDGGWVKDGQLVITPFKRREDLTPEYQSEVDEWIGLLGGDVLRRWIGKALAFECGPTAALAVVSAPGSGKQMLLRGLAECLAAPNTGVFASGAAFGDWQYGMDRSPFINVNEDWPKSGNKSLDAHFRDLVGGDAMDINQKYAAVERRSLNPRVVITGNNLEVVTKLFQRRNMSQEDVDAVSQRLIVITAGDTASNWLKEKGGKRFTEGWVGGADTLGTYKVAKHFLYLYERYKDDIGDGRFLVEGSVGSRLQWILSVSEGIRYEIGVTLLSMAADGKERVTTSEVHDRMMFSGKQASLVLIGKNMHHFAGKLGRGKWNLNLPWLEEFANHHEIDVEFKHEAKAKDH